MADEVKNIGEGANTRKMESRKKKKSKGAFYTPVNIEGT